VSVFVTIELHPTGTCPGEFQLRNYSADIRQYMYTLPRRLHAIPSSVDPLYMGNPESSSTGQHVWRGFVSWISRTSMSPLPWSSRGATLGAGVPAAARAPLRQVRNETSPAAARVGILPTRTPASTGQARRRTRPRPEAGEGATAAVAATAGAVRMRSRPRDATIRFRRPRGSTL
jgi:hypothetical protein